MLNLMLNRISKLLIYTFILMAVLGVGIWIGRSGTETRTENEIRTEADKLIAGRAPQIADIGGGLATNVEDKPDSGGADGTQLVESPAINSIRSVKVSRVLDGDTIEIEGGKRVRYLGINAPESGQPFSTRATRQNEKLVAGRSVNLEFDVQTQDRFGRLLAYVWLGDVLINKEIVKNGYAISETVQPNAKYQDLILKAQQEARDKCRGLWEGLCSQDKEDKNAPCVKIININANAPGNDNENKNGEWIEIKNTCSQVISMNNWLLRDSSASNRYEFGDFTLNGAKSVIIYSGCGVNTQDKLFWQCPEGRFAIWSNTGDHAFIYDANGNLIAEYQY